MGTRCPQCLSENQDQSKFCAECGTKLPFAADSPFTRTLVAEPPSKAPLKGTVFAERYAIIGELGRGGMGVVYKAEDARLKRTVALKFLPPGLMLIPEAKERFLREAQSAAALSHPNICTIHEVEEADGQPYIAMEYIGGENLGQKTKRGPLAGDEAAAIAVQIADGLEAAHQRGIVHRDIKPANIMVTEKGQAKIMDFGLAQVAGGSRLTKEAKTIGTIAYMSPEQAQGEDLDRRTDIWSYGVVLYEMLTGQLPFRGDRESIILHSIIEAEPKPARLINPAIPVELQKIIDRALRKKREDRYASAAEMSRDLKRYLDSRQAEQAGFFNMKSLARRMRTPAYYVPAAAVLLALGAFVYWRIDRNAHVRWARHIALPQIDKLIQANDFTAAYKLTQEAAKFIANDPQVREYSGQLTGSLSITTDPPGAQVLVKDYAAAAGSPFEPIGLTPLKRAVVPIGYKRWKIVKDGFEPVEGAGQVLQASNAPESNPVRKVALDAKRALPAGMVRVQGRSGFAAALNGASNLPPLQISDFFLDKYEVTNIEFKKFVDDGGYKRQDFWKAKFLRDGKEIPWGQAVRGFVDKTGRPGPATWEFGQPPDGREEYPVSGVSWYEAAAYAEYAGKVLPTIYHWHLASGDLYVDSGHIVPHSNFGQKGTMPAGKMQGMSPAGVYDLAGNVKEWCSNETSDGRKANVGGGWDEPSYMFAILDAYSAWSRYPNFGFRCMKSPSPSGMDTEASKPVPIEVQPPIGDLKPCSDEMFKLYMKSYEYPRSPLNPKVEHQIDVNRNTLFEEVSFDPAFLGDRTGAFIFLPKAGRGPYQTVIHWPGGDALRHKSFFDYAPYDSFDYLTKTGRAVVLPIIRGTFGRQFTTEMRAKTTPLERRAMQVKDFRRTLDYLETRAEFDVKNMAFEGLSWGGGMGSIIPAIEQRIRAIILIGAGFYYGNPPDYNPINLAPRIIAPVLIQNGRYDFFVSTEREIQPLLRIFGTPDKDKALKLYEAGHAVWLRMEQQKDEIDFLDKYFGPAK